MISFKKFDSLFGDQLQGSLESFRLYSLLSLCHNLHLRASVAIGFGCVEMDRFFGTVSFRDDGCVVIDFDDHVIVVGPSEIVSISVGVVA